jgi:hypothetical protein
MPRELKKYSIRAYDEDIALIASYYPDFGYNRIIRHFVAQLAEQIRKGKPDPLEATIQDIAPGEVND